MKICLSYLESNLGSALSYIRRANMECVEAISEDATFTKLQTVDAMYDYLTEAMRHTDKARSDLRARL